MPFQIAPLTSGPIVHNPIESGQIWVEIVIRIGIFVPVSDEAETVVQPPTLVVVAGSQSWTVFSDDHETFQATDRRRTGKSDRSLECAENLNLSLNHQSVPFWATR